MAEERNQVLDENEQYLIRKEKLAALQAEGQNPYSITKFEQTAFSEELKKEFAELPAESESGKTVSLAGRMMTKRVMGKASFAHLRDDQGDIQIYVRRDELGDEAYAAFKKLDLGDIIGITGEVFRTKTGELSVRANQLTLLSKGLRPLPDKWHGLTDTELRYRQRYVDLIMNPDVKETFKKRTRIMNEIRAFMNERGYLEVETPILTPFEIGAAARPFTTHHNTLDTDMVLRIETELYLKRLIVGGIDRVYEIGRIFRNEGMDPKHNPEFTSMESYQAYADFHDIMDLVEALFKRLADRVCGTRLIPYGDKTIDFDNWSRITMKDAVKKYSGVDFDDWKTDEDAIACAKEHNVELPEVPSRGSILAEFFDAYVEDKLVQPTFIYDYPVEISPLAKRKPDDPEFTERFEFFINCMEFGNAFSELNDPIDQRGRFERQVQERKAIEPDAKCRVDYDYIRALEYGLPPTGGLGIGIDRLIMLLTNKQTIQEVLLFPTLRPEFTDEAAEKAEIGVSAAADGKLSTDGTDTAQKGNCGAPEGICGAQSADPFAATEPIDFSKVVIEPLFTDYVPFEDFSKCDFRAVKVKSCEAVPKSKKLLKFTLDDGTGTDRVILSGIHAYYEPEQLLGKTLLAIVNLPPRPMMGMESCGMLLSAAHEEEGEEKLHLIMVDPHIPAGAKLY